jgi:Na+/melibiose symporter-like transporter
MALDQSLSGSSDWAAAPVSDAAQAAALPRRSAWGLISISLFWVAINFHWTALLIVIIPSQVEALLAQSYLHSHAFDSIALNAFITNNKAVTLALVSSPGLLVALITNPLFGLLSDRTRGRWGRRRPYILLGTLLNVVGLAIMAVSPNILTMLLALCLVQLANNAAAAPFHAFLPDLVNEKQRGTAAGMMGFAQILAIILGAFVTGQFISINNVLQADSAGAFSSAFSTYSNQLLLAYGVVSLVIFVLMVVTVLAVKEQPWTPPAGVSSEPRVSWLARYRQQVIEGAGSLVLMLLVVVIALFALQSTGLSLDANGAHLPQTASAAATSDAAQHANIAINAVLLVLLLIVTIWAARFFEFRPRRDQDFAWVVGTRLLMMLGINTVQAFLQYYFHDVLGSTRQEQDVSTFIIILTLTAALTTFFGGWLSTRFGRKRMVYLSGGMMTSVAAIFIADNFLVSAGTISPSVGFTIALLGGAIFGLGYGAYLSVDWALVADVLPNQARFACDMGIWNIALTMPQVVAFVIGSILLSLPVGASLRYTFLFVTFTLYCLAGTVTVRYIKAVKR